MAEPGNLSARITELATLSLPLRSHRITPGEEVQHGILGLKKNFFFKFNRSF